ncbi:MAG: MFS transporter [Chloroflexi bacterium]|nr:MFS transporter [Chloroflexota bacterium]
MAALPTVTEETITRFHWKMELVGGLSMLFVSLDIGLLSFALPQVVGVWGLSPIHVAVIITATSVATLLGSGTAGNAADRIGRRSALQLCLLVTALGTALGVVSWDYISLAAFQFIAGLGSGAIVPISSAFVGEFAPAKHRGRLTSLLELFWIAGALIAAFGSLLILPQLGWRFVFLFGAVPAIWVVLQFRFMPESPRYLVVQGKHDQARRFVAQVKESYGLSYDHLLSQASHANNGALASLSELWSGSLIKRTACAWLIWFVLLYTYYGVFIWWPTLLTAGGVTVMRTIQYMLVFLGVQIPAVLMAAFLVDVIGRKRLLVAAFSVFGVASYIFGNASSPSDILLWGSVLSFASVTAWAISIGYTAEMFPTRVRGTGIGSASAFGRLGTIVVPGAIVLLVNSWSTGYGLVFAMFSGLLFAGALGVGLLGEETKGRTLEEIAR